MTTNNYSIAVFPFLKTSGEAQIGELTFRPTNDTDGLLQDEARTVREVREMLYLKDDLRIQTASYAILRDFTLNGVIPDLTHLARIQAVVAYLYALPHETFGRAFLSSEHASMVVLSPCNVPTALVRPDFNVVPSGGFPQMSQDSAGQVSGYFGIYNFRHSFSVVAGSRLYGPAPHLTLNHHQDLSSDIRSATSSRHEYQLLFRLLHTGDTEFSLRIFAALLWYQQANAEAVDEEAALVNLAIAFESLLGLPESQKKSDRIVDAISLLLGRLPRLDVWARQFYDARSAVVHKGIAGNTGFEVMTSGVSQTYGSLLSYGRQIFRLCLSTLLTGHDLAEQERVEEKFITNQERFEKICQTLSKTDVPPQEKLGGIELLLEEIGRYRFVGETGLKIETLIGASRRAAQALLSCDDSIDSDAANALNNLILAKKSNNRLDELRAIQTLSKIFEMSTIHMKSRYSIIFAKVIDAVWGYVFMHYHWIENQSS